jgi:DNA adenine methylase
MHQPALFEKQRLDKIINIASVPQRSPFRYPGGKTWLVPHARQWFASLPVRPAVLIEPFAGGGIISLTVAAEHLAERVLMVELDDQVAAVWRTILGGDAEWLADTIAAFDLTAENAEAALSRAPRNLREKAFQTILKNRIYRGGILAPGSGKLKHGEDGRGIKSRWYPATLKKRILGIATLRERITFVEGDGLAVIRQNAHRADAVFFIDPPYTAAGKKAGNRLYTHFELDHEELFKVTGTVAGDFLMTYDDAAGVRELARQRRFDTQLVAMKNTHHAEMTELLMGRNLNWARL